MGGEVAPLHLLPTLLRISGDGMNWRRRSEGASADIDSCLRTLQSRQRAATAARRGLWTLLLLQRLQLQRGNKALGVAGTCAARVQKAKVCQQSHQSKCHVAIRYHAPRWPRPPQKVSRQSHLHLVHRFRHGHRCRHVHRLHRVHHCRLGSHRRRP